MKKTVAALAAVLLAGVSASANDFKDYTHWSVSVNGGISQFDGDAVQDYNKMASASPVRWIVGIEGEYTWNPYWGLKLQFDYIPYSGKTSGSFGKNTFTGWSADPALMVSVNVLNLFGPYRHDSKWGLYANAGLGMSFYGVTGEPTEGETAAAGSSTPEYFKDGRCMLFPVGLNAEYNINDYLAVGLSAYYRMHNKDNFEGENYTRGSANDGIFTFAANLRVKLAPGKRGGHVRNLSMYEYSKRNTEEGTIKSALDSLRDRLDEQDSLLSAKDGEISALRDSIYNQVLPTMDGRMDYLEGRHVEVENALSDCCSSLSGRVDTLQTRMDRLENIAYIQGQGDSSVVTLSGVADSVFFALNQSYLTSRAKHTLSGIAEKMKADPSSHLIIVGYSDASGDPDYNQLMTRRRTESVRRFLVREEIDSTRITVEPRGVVPDSPRYNPRNRRCDLVIGVNPAGPAAE